VPSDYEELGTYESYLLCECTLPDGTALVECSGPVDGAPDQISSGRAESAGVLSLGTFLLVAAEYLETSPQGQCRNYIDSTAALPRAQRTSQSQRVLRSRISSDMDLMTAYRNLGPTIYGYIKTRWVEGHQDRYLSYNKLSTQAKINMRADKLAETYREQPQAPHQRSGLSQPCVDPIPGQAIQLVISDYAISQSHAHWIRFQITGYDMRHYLQDRHDWDKPTWEAIDCWFGFEKAIRSRPPTMQRRISKLMNGWWNVGKQRRCINSKDFLLRPRCKLCRESTEHVL
jgi:hypothetical protein